jgi:hypothetical protein
VKLGAELGSALMNKKWEEELGTEKKNTSNLVFFLIEI